jgi:hypothetical protein
MDQLKQLVRGAVPVRNGDPGNNTPGFQGEHPGFGGQQPSQRCGKRGQQKPSMRVRARELDRPMQGDDRLAGSSRARHSGRTREPALNDRTLRGMQEYAPSLPRIIERLAQLLLVNDQPDAPLRVGMNVGIPVDGQRRRRGQRAGGGAGSLRHRHH